MPLVSGFVADYRTYILINFQQYLTTAWNLFCSAIGFFLHIHESLFRSVNGLPRQLRPLHIWPQSERGAESVENDLALHLLLRNYTGHRQITRRSGIAARCSSDISGTTGERLRNTSGILSCRWTITWYRRNSMPRAEPIEKDLRQNEYRFRTYNYPPHYYDRWNRKLNRLSETSWIISAFHFRHHFGNIFDSISLPT